jgi:hypothetical protein
MPRGPIAAAIRAGDGVKSALWGAGGRLLLLMVVPLGLARALPAQQVSSHTLVYALYESEATAGDVLASMRKAQEATGEQIASYAVVSRDPDGKIAVHQRPVRDARSNAAIDLMLGTLGQPASGPAVGANGIASDVVTCRRSDGSWVHRRGTQTEAH